MERVYGNNALLKELEYTCIETINNHIKVVKKQYAVPIYESNFIDELSDCEIQCTVNDQLFRDNINGNISFGGYMTKTTAKKKT